MRELFPERCKRRIVNEQKDSFAVSPSVTFRPLGMNVVGGVFIFTAICYVLGGGILYIERVANYFQLRAQRKREKNKKPELVKGWRKRQDIHLVLNIDHTSKYSMAVLQKTLLDMHFRYDIQRTRLVSVVETVEI